MSSNFPRVYLPMLVRGENLTREQASSALMEIFQGDVDGPLIASFLTALTAKGETIDEMTGFVDAMMMEVVTEPVGDNCVDIVGTGGDQLHSVNISTMASLAVAGCGVPVAKHGNRSATSSVGSADVLEALGVALSVDGDTVRRSIEEANFGFYFAPVFHPALVALAPIRRALGFRTIFNVLGPLANPAQVRRTLIGVAQEHLLGPMASVLQARGIDRALLVRGDDGLDEVSLGATTTVVTVEHDHTTSERRDFDTLLGIQHHVSALVGGDVATNAGIVRRFLDGEPGPVFDVVCANAALALVAARHSTSVEDGFAAAQESVMSGRARTSLERAIAITNA